MQKPTAYGASVLLLILILMKTSEAGNQHEQVCVSPGPNGQYSVFYNKNRLPVENPREVQDAVLRGVSTEFTNEFLEGCRLEDLCTGRETYSAVSGHYIDLFSYAYCDQGVLDRPGCIQCLQGGVQAINQICGESCDGAQASSDNCCIRFEGVEFCQVT